MDRNSINISDNSGSLPTFFASAELAGDKELEEEVKAVRESPLFHALEDAIDGYLLIVNPQRQVLAVNPYLMKDLGVEGPQCLVGSRYGEIMHCIHATDGPGGCGTAKACAHCGGIMSLLNSQSSRQSVEGECLMTVQRNGHSEAMEFHVRSTPITIGKHQLTIMVLHDISSEKRKEALEQVFFHDILNTVGGLVGWTYLLQGVDTVDPQMAATQIMRLSERLSREIKDQQMLMQAEGGNLMLAPEKLPIALLLVTLQTVFEANDITTGKYLEIDEASTEEMITTDASLLERVLTNMIKNALEAVEPGATVRVSFERNGADVIFNVHNPGVIAEDVSLRIFQRSFSTKSSKGRGLGTYSMKLLGERHLKGKVSFQSSEAAGTVFSIRLPEQFPENS
jgi:signal transduction histidine kinase